MRKIPNRPKLFKGWTRSWYWDSVIDDLDEEDTDDTDDSSDDSGDDSEDTGDTGETEDSGDSGETEDSGDDEGDSGDSGEDEGDSGDDSGDSSDDSGDDSGDSGDDSDDEEEDDSTVTVEVNGTTYSFSTEYETETATAAVTALESDIESEDEETVDEFEAVVGEDEVLAEYLGCYEVSAETGVLTLASPVEVTDPEVYIAIVLHYNDDTGEWEQVSDVQIIDGYVYAVFTSLSPVAVYLVKKKYVATVTIGEEVTQYETIAEAVAYTEANLDSTPVLALTWNKSITETIGPLYATPTGNMTFDLGGYTIYASVDGGSAIDISGDACTTSLVVQNGSIVCDDVTTCGINIYDQYATLNEVNISTTCVGATGLKIDGVKAYPTDCVITAENGYAITIQATDVAGLTSMLTSCTITTTNKDENEYPAILLANVNSNAFLISLSSNCVISGDVYGIYNDSIAGKCYCYGDELYITAPTALYISSNHTAANGFYTSTTNYVRINGSIVSEDTAEDGIAVVALKLAYLTEAPSTDYIYTGYALYDNDDETYAYKCAIDQVVECTTTDGTVTYKNSISTAALSAAGTGGTVKLLKDYSGAGLGSISVNNVTMDLNGFTYTVTGAGIYSTSKDYTFTIKNGYLTSTSTTADVNAIRFTRGTLNVEDVTITTNDDGSTNSNGIAIGNTSSDYAVSANITGSTVINAPTGILVQNSSSNTNVATLTVGEGVTINSRDYAIAGNGSYDGTVINIEGGTFTCTGDGSALYHPQAGNLTINGGTFTGVNSGIQICDGDATINDATVTVTGEDLSADKTGDGNIPDAAALSVVNRSGYSSSYPTLTVKGGTFKSTNGSALKAYAWASNTMSEWDATGYIKVSGGNFSDVVDSAYIEDGYACSTEATDGLYTVSASA